MLPINGAVDGSYTPMGVAVGQIYLTQTLSRLHYEHFFCLSKHVILGYVHTALSSYSSAVCRKVSWLGTYTID